MTAPELPLQKPSTRARRRSAMRWVRRLVLLLVVVGVAALIVVAWLPKPVPVETATAVRGTLEVTVDEDGRARVKDRYVVSAPLGGNLARIELHPGDAVKQGDVLARIVPLAAPLLDIRSRKAAEAHVKAAAAALKQANAAIERAKVALSFARLTVNRERELVKTGNTTQASVERADLEERSRAAELTSAEFAARIAAYEQQMAEAALGRHDTRPGAVTDEQMIVPSPVTGRILKVFQESEGVVQAGAALVEVGDPEALEVVVDVLTSDAVQINPGASVTLERWGGPPLRGSVRVVEPSAFTKISSLGVEEQRVNVVIDLREPYEHWSALGDGYRVEARIIAWKADDVVKVPSSAVFRHGDGFSVYVVEGDVAGLRPVKIGRRNGFEAQVESGLEPGRIVVVHPGDRVRDGVRIAPP